jgi:endo-1,4-beta-xylanase
MEDKMKIKRIGLFLITVLLFLGCNTDLPDVSATLVVGDKKDLKPLLDSSINSSKVTWSSEDDKKVSVDNGVITAALTNFTAAEGGIQKYTQGPAKVIVDITAKEGNNTQVFTITVTTEGQINMMDLPPLKNQIPAGILIGNIATGNDAGDSAITNAALLRHFNALTAENNMKPNAISNNRNAATGVISYNWTNADKFVNAAENSGFKVIGHTLLWHSQIPAWQTSMANAGSAAALEAMKQFINDVVTHYKGRIYSWDVLNEAFPDGVAANANWRNVMRTENPWYKAIGADFVYEGFLAARLADPDAILYYNDFNTDQTGKATMIRNMVQDVNNKYKAAYPTETRLLIEGIGMQEHHNTGVSASNIRNTLNLFKPLGVKVAVSELDVLAQGWSSFSSVGQGANKHGQSTVTNNDLLTQANLYRQYMDVYMDFKDIIERITFWGVTDNQSWRSAGLPLLFDNNGKAKPAYYRFIGAIK